MNQENFVSHAKDVNNNNNNNNNNPNQFYSSFTTSAFCSLLVNANKPSYGYQAIITALAELNYLGNYSTYNNMYLIKRKKLRMYINV